MVIPPLIELPEHCIEFIVHEEGAVVDDQLPRGATSTTHQPVVAQRDATVGDTMHDLNQTDALGDPHDLNQTDLTTLTDDAWLLHWSVRCRSCTSPSASVWF